MLKKCNNCGMEAGEIFFCDVTSSFKINLFKNDKPTVYSATLCSDCAIRIAGMLEKNVKAPERRDIPI